MAVFCRAQDERLNRQVALKVLAPALAADEDFRHRFIREARSAAAVDDPHIIPVFEAGEADAVLFIAMRYVPGGDVRALLRRLGPRPRPGRPDHLGGGLALMPRTPPGWSTGTSSPPTCWSTAARPPDHVYPSDFGLTRAVSSASVTGTGGCGDAGLLRTRGDPGAAGRCDEYAGCAVFT
jgi:serine/threonine-protein kinase